MGEVFTAHSLLFLIRNMSQAVSEKARAFSFGEVGGPPWAIQRTFALALCLVQRNCGSKLPPVRTQKESTPVGVDVSENGTIWRYIIHVEHGRATKSGLFSNVGLGCPRF